MVKTTIKDLERILCRFQVDDLRKFVFPEFPEVTFSDAKKKIIIKKSPLTVKSFALIISNTLSDLDENSIKKRIGCISLIEASLHTTRSRQRWMCYQMHTNSTSSSQILDYTEEGIEETLRKQCMMAGIKVICKVIFHDGIYWISLIIEKIVKGSGIKLQRPILFAFSPSDSFLFSGQRNVSRDMLMALRKALMFEALKVISLEGCHIRDLLRILKMKGQQGLDDSNESVRLKRATFKSGKHVADGRNNVIFLESKKRRTYAEAVFGKNPPVMDKLIINAPECPCPWDLELTGQTISMKAIVNAPNVCKYLTDLAVFGVLKAPFAPYIEGILPSGKSIIGLRPAAK